jgi:hypothetical protein
MGGVAERVGQVGIVYFPGQDHAPETFPVLGSRWNGHLGGGAS